MLSRFGRFRIRFFLFRHIPFKAAGERALAHQGENAPALPALPGRTLFFHGFHPPSRHILRAEGPVYAWKE